MREEHVLDDGYLGAEPPGNASGFPRIPHRDWDDDSMYRITSSSGRVHLSPSNRPGTKSLCNLVSVDSTRQALMLARFDSFDDKPRSKWCGKCREKFREQQE